MLTFIEAHITLVLAVILVLLLVFILAFFLAMLQVRALKNKFDRFMRPNSKNHNIEIMLNDYLDEIHDIKIKNDSMFEDMEDVKRVLKTSIQKIGIVKYNTFEDIGGELSYAIALLDQNDSGIVLNSLYYRDGSYTYAKQIISGDCVSPLSDEENEAISAAKNNINNIVFKDRMDIKKRKKGFGANKKIKGVKNV